ncbi:MAG TPA: extracellular solute-binding protein [bacterium]|nr:extracellular solute-binding protein [bacterium]
MWYRWRLWVMALAGIAAATVLPAAQAQPDLAAVARQEGRVVVYGSLESPIFEVIQQLYKEKYGIPVEYFRLATNRLLDRVLTEVRAGKPQFDVVLTNLSPMLIMKQAGAFAHYTSPSYAAFPPASLDKDGILSPPYRAVVVSILYNTRLVTADEAPRTLEDLLAPKWKGKVVMPDPTEHITAAIWLANLQSVMGAEYRTFVERLAGQAVLVDSFDPAMQKIVAGEYPLGLTYVKYVYVMGKQGAPIDYVRLNPMLAEAHHVALGVRPNHPNAARLFIDLFTSRLGLLTLAQAGEFVLVPGIYPPIKDAKTLHLRLMHDLDDQQLRRWRGEFGAFFRH